MRKHLVATLVVGAAVLMGGEVMAQSTATGTGTATANIIAPITITSTVPLAFGDVIPGIATGTVVMTPAGVRTATGGATLGNLVLGTAGAFTVTGAANYAYTITLPASIAIAGAGTTMTVTPFTSNPTGSAGLLTGGTQNLAVGATLNVGASQLAGVYSGPFDVTVAYN